MQNIKVKFASRVIENKVFEQVIKDVLALDEFKSDIHAFDISLNLSPEQIASYAKEGNNLVITLANGQVIIIDDYFAHHENGLKNRLFLSQEGEITLVDLASLEPQGVIGTTNAAENTAVAANTTVAANPGLIFPAAAGSSAGSALSSAGALVAGAGAASSTGALAAGGGANEEDPNTAIPQAPAITAATETTISGIAEPGSTVTVTVNGQTFTVPTDPVTGAFTISAPEGTPFPVEAPVVAIAVDPQGNESPEGNGIVVDTSAPSAPLIEEANEESISGTAEPGSTVTVIVDGQEFTVPTDPVTGAFTISAPEGTSFPVDAPIIATAIDPQGNQGPASNGTIVDVNAPAAPVIEAPTDAGIFGTAEPGTTVTVTIAGQEFTVPTDPVTGAFAVFPPEGTTFLVNAPVTATAIDPAGNESTEGTGTIIDASAPPAPVIEEATEVGISGTAEPGATVFISIGGQEFTVPSDPVTGAFTVSPPAGTIFPVDAPVTVTAADSARNVSPQATSTIVGTTAPAAPVIEEATEESISGTSEPGATVTVTVGGQEFTVPTDPVTGAFTVSPPAGTTFPVDTPVTATAIDPQGNESSEGNSTIVDVNAPAAPVIEEATEEGISGTAEPGATVTVTVGGQEFTVPTDPVTGAFTVSAPAGTTFPVDTPVTATAIDPQGNESSEGNGTIVDVNAPAAPVIEEATEEGVSGTAEPGATVTVTVGGQEFTVPTDPVTGAFTVSPPAGTTFPVDTPVVATAIDPQGNESAEGNGTITDVNAPANPTVETVTTNNPTPTITGTAEPESTVTVEVGGAIFETIAGSDGTFSINTGTEAPISGSFEPNLNGTNEVIATSTDASGNSATDTSTGELIINTTAPTAPTVDELIINDTTPTITGSVVLEAGETLSVTIDGVTYTTDNGLVIDSANNIWTLTLPDSAVLEEGTFEVIATVTDAAGNQTSDSSTNEIVIDTQAPALSFSGVSVATDDIVNAAEAGSDSVPVSGTVDGAEEGDEVTVTVNGVESTGIVDADGNFTVNVAGTDLEADPNGVAEISVTSTDEAGNTTTQEFEQPFTVDTQAPALSFSGVSVATDDIVNAAEAGSDSVPVSGTVTGAEEGDEVTVTVNGVESTGIVDADGNFTVNVAGTDLEADPNGVAEISVTSTDEAGNTTTQEFEQPFTVDTQAPALSFSGVSVATDDIVNAAEAGSDSVPVSGTVDGAEEGDEVTVTVNGVESTGIVDADGNFTVNVAGTDLEADPNGVAEISVTSTDEAGNTTTQEFEQPFTVDTQAPALSFSGVSVATDDIVNAAEAGSDSVPVSGTVDGAEEGDEVTVTVNGVESTGIVDADGNFTVNVAGTDLEADPDGVAEISVTSTDEAGNTTTQEFEQPFTVDTQAPALSFSGVSVATDDIVNAAEAGSDSVPVSGTVDGAEEGDEVTVTVNGVESTGIVDADGNFTVNVAGTDLEADPDGVAEISVTSTDEAGNTTTQEFEQPFTMDTQAPALSFSGVSVATDDIVNAAEAGSDSVPVSGTVDGAEEGDEVTVTVNGVESTGIVDADGNFTVNVAGTDLEADPDGVAEISVTSTDEAGNTTTQEFEQPFTVDTQAPALSFSGVSVATDDIVNAAEAGSDSVPVSGTVDGAEEGDEVTVTVNGVESTGIVDADGNFTVNVAGTDLEADPDGVAEISVTSTDEAGNTTTQEFEQPFTVDTQAPALSFSGVSVATDDIVNAAEAGSDSVPVSGTVDGAEEGDEVTVTVNGVESTGIVDADGNFTVNVAGTDLEADPNGVAEISVTSTDEAGNTTTQEFEQPFTVDITAPTVDITIDDSALSIGETATVTFTFSEAPSGFDASDISATNGTISGFTQSATDPTMFTATFTPDIDTESTAVISIADDAFTDVAGNQGTGDSLIASVDTSAPAITIDNTITTVNTIITGTAEADLDIAFFDANSGNPIPGTISIDADGNFTFTPDVPLADGVEVEARQTDDAGNTGTAEQTLQLDTDGDGVRDSVDIDDDNDGILDSDENAFLVLNSGPIDRDNDTPQPTRVDFVDQTFSVTEDGPLTLTLTTTNPPTVSDVGFSIFPASELPAPDPSSVVIVQRGFDADNPGGTVVANFEAGVEYVVRIFTGGGGSADDVQLEISGANLDTDNDGLINAFDTDSDNGGVDDIIEAQFGNVFIEPSGVDANQNGLDDAFEATPGTPGLNPDGIGLTPADTDGNGVADFLDGPLPDAAPVSVNTSVTGDANGNPGTLVTGTGVPGAIIILSVGGTDLATSPVTVTVDADGTFTATLDEGLADNTSLTATQTLNVTDNNGSAVQLTSSDTQTIELDFDADGIRDSFDIDDDDDGILDTVENTVFVNPLEASGAVTTGTLDAFFGRIDSTSGTNGNFLLGSNAQLDGGGAPRNGTAEFALDTSGIFADQSTTFSIDVGLLGNGNILAEFTVELVVGGEVIGEFTGIDPTPNSFSPFFFGTTLTQDQIDSGVSVLITVPDLNVGQRHTVLFDNIQFGTVVSNDIDNDGILNSLDRDNDAGGIADIIEAQFDQTFIAPLFDTDGNAIDVDNDGLNDAFDDNVLGAANSGGLIPSNADGNNLADFADNANGAGDATPVTLNPSVTGNANGVPGTLISGTGVPGATIALTDANGDPIALVDENGDAINPAEVTVGADGTFTAIAATPVEDDAEITATQTLNVTDSNGDAITLIASDTQNIALDFDNDGARDSIDLDDDNDGIFDVNEGSATIINGSFEADSTRNNTTSLTGFTVESGNIDITSSASRVTEGSQSIDLNGNTNGSIFQIIETVPGQTYTLAFDFRANFFDDRTFEVSATANGETTALSEASFITSDTVNFETGLLTFTATSDETVIRFTSTSATDPTGGVFLDNIRIGDDDNDGIENRLDTDSDNGGISDFIESGGTDTDGNGMLDVTTEVSDLLPDGFNLIHQQTFVTINNLGGASDFPPGGNRQLQGLVDNPGADIRFTAQSDGELIQLRAPITGSNITGTPANDATLTITVTNTRTGLSAFGTHEFIEGETLGGFAELTLSSPIDFEAGDILEFDFTSSAPLGSLSIVANRGDNQPEPTGPFDPDPGIPSSGVAEPGLDLIVVNNTFTVQTFFNGSETILVQIPASDPANPSIIGSVPSSFVEVTDLGDFNLDGTPDFLQTNDAGEDVLPVALNAAVTGNADGIPGTLISGTGFPGATIALTDANGDPIALVDENGDLLDPAQVTVGENGAFTAIAAIPLEDNAEVTATQTLTVSDGDGGTTDLTSSVDQIIELDFDADGVRDSIDIDDDGDGILDVNEQETVTAPLNLSDPAQPSAIIAGDNIINVESIITGGVTGDANGELQLSQSSTGNGSSITLIFDEPTVLVFGGKQGADGAFFDSSDRVTLSADGATFTVSDPENDITASGTNSETVTFGNTNPIVATNNFDEPWTITTSPVTSITISYENPTLPVNSTRIRILSVNPVETDADNDNIISRLDTDSDGGGIDDLIEAQFGQEFIQPSGVDSDGNGLDDAFESAPGAGEGITLVDSDGNGVADFLDGPLPDAAPVSINPLVAGFNTVITGTGVPGSTIALTDANGDQIALVDENGDPVDPAEVTVGADGSFTAIPATPLANDAEIAATQSDVPHLADTDNPDATTSITQTVAIDTDADGVRDTIDIDDDNDGILDTDEQASNAESNIVIDGGFVSTSVADAQAAGFTFGSFAGITTSANSGLTGGLFDEVGGINGPGGLNIPTNGTEPAVTLDLGQLSSGNHRFAFDVMSNSTTPANVPLLVTIFNTTTNLVHDVLFNETLNGFAPLGSPQTVEGSFSIPVGSTDTFELRFHGLGNGTQPFDYSVDRIAIATSANFDDDGIENRLDLDSDNGGVFDIVEAGGVDANNDGRVDNFADDNGNGLDDAIEAVQGTDTGFTPDDINANGVADFLETDIDGQDDSDGDGIVNTIDIDDDNDGILDVVEGGLDIQNAQIETLTAGQATGTLNSAGQSIGFTVAPSNGASINSIDAIADRILFEEGDSGTITTTFDDPVSDISVIFGSIFQGNSVGNFSVTLADGTVLSNIDFIIEPDLPSTFGGTADVVAQRTRTDGRQEIFDPDTTSDGGNDQAGGLLTFPGLTQEQVVNGGGIQSFSFEVIDSPQTASASFEIIASSFVNPDIDGDGVVNRLDTDSDNGGIDDIAEAQFDQAFIAPLFDTDGNPVDVDQDGLNDAFDQDTSSSSSAETSIGLTPVDADGNGVLDFTENETTQTNFEFTGTEQTFIVPDGVTSIDVSAFGAGGGDGAIGGAGDSGGAGGFVSATLAVNPGDEITIIVGEGGEVADTTPQFGGGGAGGDGPQFVGSSGGGRSAILINGVEVLTAGGGGGGAGGRPAFLGTTFAGAGGETGQDGTASAGGLPGGGATDSVGGIGGVAPNNALSNGEAGTQFQGGTGGDTFSVNAGAGGGGGGGFFGGGGGAGQFNDSANVQDSSGGGGSSFADPTVATNVVFIDGNRETAPTGTGVTNAPAGTAQGGQGGADGGNGFVTISFSPTETAPVSIDPLVTGLNTVITGTGVPGSTITLSDVNGDPITLVDEDGNPISPAEVTVGPDGTFTAIPATPLAENAEISVSQSNIPHLVGTPQENNISSSTQTIALDTDGDGVADSIDIDDDNDGILDVDENPAVSVDESDIQPINFSTLTSTTQTGDMLNFGSVTTVSGQTVNVTGTLVSRVGTANLGSANGDLGLGDDSGLDVVDVNSGSELLIEFDNNARVVITGHNGIGNFNNSEFNGTTTGDVVRLEAEGGFTVFDPDGQLNIISQTDTEIVFGPSFDVQGDVIAPGADTFQIISNNAVDALTVQVDGDTRGPINVGIIEAGSDVISLLDSDGDGIINRLDTDSDNGGIDDIIEAGGVDANNDGRVDNFADDNGNGLDDAIEVIQGADTGLTPDDIDANGVADFLETDAAGNDAPIITNATQSLVTGFAVPNTPVEIDITDAGGAIVGNATGTSDANGRFSINLDPPVGPQVPFISEIDANGFSFNEFVEIVVPTNVDPAEFIIGLYDQDGNLFAGSNFFNSGEFSLQDIFDAVGGGVGSLAPPVAGTRDLSVTLDPGNDSFYIVTIPFEIAQPNIPGRTIGVTLTQVNENGDPVEVLQALDVAAGEGIETFTAQEGVASGAVFTGTPSDTGDAVSIQLNESGEFVSPLPPLSPGAFDFQELTATATATIDGNQATSITVPIDLSDTDRDGIANSIDIDDDGDGILDTEEQSPITVSVDFTSGGSGSATGNLVNIDTDPLEIVGTIAVTTGTDINGSQLFTRDYDGQGGTDDVPRVADLPQEGVAIATNLSGITSTLTPSVNIVNPIILIDTLDSVIYDFSATDITRIELVDINDNTTVDINGSVVAFDPSPENGGSIALRLIGTFGPDNPIEFLGTSTTDVVGGDGATQVLQLVGTAQGNIDADRDGIENRLDTDSDNGGIVDIVEAQLDQAFIAPTGNDTDRDGLDDAFDVTPTQGADGSLGLSPADSDNDGTADFLDEAGGVDIFTNTDGAEELVFTGNGITLDFTLLDDNNIDNIENINLTGDGANTLILDANDLLDLSGAANELTIFGDGDDSVTVNGNFTPDGTRDVDGENFDVYVDGTATLIVDPDVMVTVVP